MVHWFEGRGVVARVSFAFAILSGCGPATKPPAQATPTPTASASTAPARTEVPEPARRTLRTGAVTPVVLEKPLELELYAHTRDGKYELFEVALPDVDTLGLAVSMDGRWRGRQPPFVALEPSPAFAFTGPAGTVEQHVAVQNELAERRGRPSAAALPPTPAERALWVPRLWIRRPISDAPLRGTFHTTAEEYAPGTVAPFVVKGTAKPDAQLKRRFAQAASLRFVGRDTAFDRFAERRISETFLGRKPPTLERPRSPESFRYDLSRLMNTVTGRLSVQAALQENESLRVAVGKARRTKPITAVAKPELTHHDWAALSKALAKPATPEPLAELAPAEFYFVRSREVGKLFDLIDEIEAWGQPVADWIDGIGQRRDTFERYQTELGLVSSGLAAALGPRVLREVALVGSDPFIHEGTDVTLLLRPSEPALLRAALSAMLTARGASVGDGPKERFIHEGVDVTLARSPSGRVRRFQATVSGLEVLSNSEAAIRRVISAALGKRPRLADEPDFQYMLARDAAAPDDVLVYMGDRFIDHVSGPALRIAEARRQLAIAELSIPGYAALVAGTLDARFPASLEELFQSRLLKKTDLVHADGARIEFSLETGARSKWGSLDGLVPLIELPPVEQVTELEAQAYEDFARHYQSLWSDRLDPIALRIRLTDDARGSRKLSGDLRVLPLVRGKYRNYLELVGRAAVTAPALDKGGRVLFALGEDAELRQELSRMGRGFFGGSQRLHFDWLGGYAGFGVDDRNELVNAVHGLLGDKLQPPEYDSEGKPKQSSLSESLLIDLPVYALVAIKSRIAAGVALAALRSKLEQAAPGVASWGEGPAYRNVPTVEVKVDRVMGSGPLTLYYALTDSVLVLSLNRATLERAIDRSIDAPPQASELQRRAGASELTQLVTELSTSPGSALSALASWAFTYGRLHDVQRSRYLAEAVFLADPARANDVERARALSMRFFGTAVTTPEGRDYELAKDGVRDPVRGTAHAPIWPELPVPGSPLAHFLERLHGIRTDLSFDDEPTPPLLSLHARLQLTLDK